MAFSAAIAAWVWRDAVRRRASKPLFVAALTVWMGPLFLAFYLADRPLLATERRDGGFAWTMAKNFAFAWTGYCTPLVVPVSAAVTFSRSPAVYLSVLGTTLGGWLIPVAVALLLGRFMRKPEHSQVGGQATGSNRMSLPAAFIAASLLVWGIIGIAML